MEESGLDDVVKVQGNQVNLTEEPENPRVITVANHWVLLTRDSRTITPPSHLYSKATSEMV
jgi:hypothetical protein